LGSPAQEQSGLSSTETLDSASGCDATLEHLSSAADEWGAGWTREGLGGRLELPVTAGVRSGVLTCSVVAEQRPEGCRLVLSVESESYRLNTAAVFILLVGGLGAVAATLWPFFPQLLSVAPLAVVLALCAWFLVAARVRTSTASEFLELVGDRCASP
jgi:hypothetical protein